MFARRFTSKNERGENALLLVQGHSESPETWEITSNPEYITAPGVRIGAVEITGTAIDRFAELESAAGGWISVKDRLPEHFARVLVFRAGKNSINTDGIFTAWLVQHPDMFRNHEVWVLAGTRNDCISGVTHWMELPAPPSD